MKTKQFPALTGIRFVAASMVFFCHYPALLASKAEDPFFFYFLRQLNVGVNVFFVLSGFLITYRYYGRQGTSFRTYFLKRFARIYPLYFLLLLFHYWMQYRQSGAVAPVFEVFLNLSLLKGLSQQYYLSGIAQSWSLTVEEMFYAAAPLLALFIGTKQSLVKMVIALLAIGIMLAGIFHILPFHGFFSGLSFVFSATFFGRCFEFACGIYLALRVMNQASCVATSTRFTVAGSLLFLSLLFVQTAYATAFDIEAVNKTIFGIIVSNFLFPVAIALCFYGLVTEQTRLQKTLSSRLFAVLGKSSYAFYLLHLGFAAEMVYFHFSSHWLVLFLCLQVMSVVLYKTVEQPVYSFLVKTFSAPRQKVTQGVVLASS